MVEIHDLIVRMAEENPTWGYTRIGFSVAIRTPANGRGLVALTPAASTAIRRFARDELAVPTKNDVGRHDRRDVGQQPAAQAMAQLGGALTLKVIETQTSSLQPRLRYPILFAQERDHVLLLALKPPAHHRNYELKRKHR